jgi:hypothetical protein
LRVSISLTLNRFREEGTEQKPVEELKEEEPREEDKDKEYYAVFVGGLTRFVPPHLLKDAFSACGMCLFVVF